MLSIKSSLDKNIIK